MSKNILSTAFTINLAEFDGGKGGIVICHDPLLGIFCPIR